MIEDTEKDSEEKKEIAEVEPISDTSDLHKVVHVESMFENWFIDYASYSILDRAIPDIMDGLKPVQRRILHAMSELEDGRFNKVANIIGHTMKYHPHGDRSIGDALVQLGQKNLTVETQGNWGNLFTGDSAAAPRYIEARLSKFALEVAFNPKITNWQLSYDGRNKEPITLPIKFPLLLAQGVEGIAVGLSTKILPHNFNELIDASIAILENKDFEIYPDFPNGGSIDIRKYNDGKRGGRLRNRAKITILDKKILVINEIPYGINTTSLIADSITPAIERGKLKIKKIDDNTSDKVEILLHLYPGVSPDQTLDALYAFTNCEISHSPNACVLYNDAPQFMSVKEILRINTYNTVSLLKQELEITLAELSEQWHKISLEKIFFEKRIYKELEKETQTWDIQIDNIETAFNPYRSLFNREITRDDILKLCEKPVRKISKFDIKEAEEKIKSIELDMSEVQNNLDHLIDYTIYYFQQIKKKYGKGKERQTEIKNFDNIVATNVAVANQKLYVDKKEGFVGTGLKKSDTIEYVCDCSDIDEIIIIRDNGTFSVSKVSEKHFFGKGIIHVAVFKRNDERTIYNVVYADGYNGNAMIKRFAIGGITRDKDYQITKGKEGSKILYLTSNPNGEAEKIKIYLKPKPKIKKLTFEFDFSSLAIKGRSSQGNILTRHAIRKIELSEKGISTLSAINIYFDTTVNRLVLDDRALLIGSFKRDDKIIAFYNNGYYKVSGFDLTTHFDDNILIIKKLTTNLVATALYFHKKENKYYIKRFKPDTTDKKIDFIPDDKDVNLVTFSIDFLPQIEIEYYLKNPEDTTTTTISCADYVDIMNIKARGKRINLGNITRITLLDPLPYNEEIQEIEEDFDDDNDGNDNYQNMDEEIAKEVFHNIDNQQSEKEITTNNKSEEETGEQLSLF